MWRHSRSRSVLAALQRYPYVEAMLSESEKATNMSSQRTVITVQACRADLVFESFGVVVFLCDLPKDCKMIQTLIPVVLSSKSIHQRSPPAQLGCLGQLCFELPAKVERL